MRGYRSVVFLMGPTATGKSDLAIALAQTGRYEIISVDSVMVYRGLDIGTAKPSAEIRAVIPHHLIDICDPSVAYSVARFRQDALLWMEDIFSRGKMPLCVGGTMLYFKALRDGLALLPEADPAVRASILSDAADRGWPALHTQLTAVDPATAARIKPNDKQRIQRALEVFLTTGIPLSTLQYSGSVPIPYGVVSIGLMPPTRAWLHQRIEDRFRDMLNRGLLAEVKSLYDRGDLHAGLPAIRSVGYRQVWAYLGSGQGDLAALLQQGVIATRQFAKRQLTWLRHWQGLHTVDCTHPDLLTEVLRYLNTSGNETHL